MRSPEAPTLGDQESVLAGRIRLPFRRTIGYEVYIVIVSCSETSSGDYVLWSVNFLFVIRGRHSHFDFRYYRP